MSLGTVEIQQPADLVGQLAVMTLALDMVDADVEQFGAVQENTIDFVRKVRGTS